MMIFTINMRNYKTAVRIVFFGILIGVSFIIPGMSGGTTAVILGVYDQILTMCCNLTKNPKYIAVLFLYAIGGALGLFAVSKPLEYIISAYPVVFGYLILGILIGTINVFLQKNTVSYVNRIFLFMIGMTPVIFQFYISKYFFVSETNNTIWIMIGLISSIAFILPGISLTNVLFIFDSYDKLLDAINNLNIKIILLFTISLIVGSILSIKALTKLYDRYRDKINIILAGMVCASAVQVYPGTPSSSNFIICIAMMILGFIVSLKI